MKDPYAVAFGLVIRDLRIKKNLSQEAFADLAGVDRSYMGRIERGEKNITLAKIYEVCGALGMTPAQVFQRIDIK